MVPVNCNSLLTNLVNDEEVDDVTNAIFDEIGLDVSNQMSKAKAPNGKLGSTATTSSKMDDRELQKLLEGLP